MNFGGTQINLNGINNFGLIGGNFGGANLNMAASASTLTSAGIIYNQNLKQKFSGSSSGSLINFGGNNQGQMSIVKSGKIKAEYFKSQIKTGASSS